MDADELLGLVEARKAKLRPKLHGHKNYESMLVIVRSVFDIQERTASPETVDDEVLDCIAMDEILRETMGVES